MTMGKDKIDKRDKEKKHKRSETDGVKKSKKDKKIKLTDDNIAAAFEEASKSIPKSPDRTIEQEIDGIIIAEQKPLGSLVPFANPLANEKVAKKVLKSIKKAAKNKTLKRGVKEVVKILRKSPSGTNLATAPGVVILAADISPMDVISHIPVLCEDHQVPYIFVTSRAELGAAGCTKRPTSVVMVMEKRAGGSKKDEKEIEKEKGKGEDEVVEDFTAIFRDLVKVVEKEARNVRV